MLTLVQADAALAQVLGWERPVPLLAAGLKRADLRKLGEDLRLVFYWVVTTSTIEAMWLAAYLGSCWEWREIGLQERSHCLFMVSSTVFLDISLL